MQSLQRLDETNRPIIDSFLNTLPVLSPGRVKKYRLTLNVLSRRIDRSLEGVSKEDLKHFIESVNQSSEYTDYTKRDYRLLAKKFFAWLRDPEFVAWIKVGKVKNRIGPEDILSEEELSRMRYVCENVRDKAAVETLNEAALRPHEFLGLKKSNVSFDEYGAVVYVEKGKTGPRRIRVLNATPLLANWIENHPLKSRDAPLWIDLSTNSKYERLKWHGLSRLIRRLCKDANIEKHITAYIFRHTRLTFLAKFMTEAQLCEFAGWEQGSDMPRKYVHLSGRDLDDSLLKVYGLKQRDTAELKAPRKCVRCGTLCAVESETCHKCGMPLTLEVALKADQAKQSEISQMNERISKLERFLGEEGLGLLQCREKLEKSLEGSGLVSEH